MSRKNYIPGSDKTDKRIIKYDTSSFGSAVVEGSKIPDDALSDAYDVVIYPDMATGRGGSQVFTSVKIPALDNRTGYEASKSGDIITANESIFTEEDVSNYFVFPGTPDTHYEIVEYISGTQVKSFSTGNHFSTENCYLRGKTNLNKWHKIVRKWIFMWGQQIYVAKWDIQELVRCRIISKDLPYNSVSGYDDLDKFSGIIFNSNGMFRIDLERETPLVYKINVPIPNISIPDVAKQSTSKYNYRYLYSAARLFEEKNIVNRLTPSRIEQETGTNIWDSSYKDYADIYTDGPIGDEAKIYQRLVCGELDEEKKAASYWVDNIGYYGEFYFTANGNEQVYVNPNLDNILTMAEMANIIQTAIRDYYSEATCEYDNGRFIITAGIVNGYTVDFLSPGLGLDIAALLKGTAATGAVVESITVESPKLIGPLYIPNVPNTSPQEYQWHFTHLPVYRTKDLLGRYKINVDADQFNSPNDFIWVDDVRTCGAFWGYRTGGYFIAEQGEFELSDTGSVLEFEDGSRFEILEYISSSTVRISTYYYSDVSSMMACAIGNGRVLRAYQEGNIVTRIAGDDFSSSDVRKPLKWATGYWSYITEYLDSNRVRVLDDQDKTTMGVTIDPVYRNFYDTLSDENLDARATRLKLKQRYWEAMDNANVGKITPGLIVTAQRGNGQLNYGQIPATNEYLHGYHDKGYQISNVINDDIQLMAIFQDVLIIWTSNKTWRWSTANYQYITNPYTKDAIFQMLWIEVIDEQRGCYDWGSVESIGNSQVVLLTSEPGKIGWRAFNGHEYGPNLLESMNGKDRIPAIQDLQQATKALYDGRAGLMLFGRE